MNKKLLTIIVSLLTIVQTIEAFTGNGTETSPYLIQAVADWEQLASDVSGGNAYQGSFFRLTADISVKTCVGSEEHAFSGTFDGANHTLTLNIGDAVNYVDKPIAPFVSLSGATIQHLKTAGTLYISHRFAAGVASYIRGAQPTTIYDCKSEMTFNSAESLNSDACHGGFVGLADEGAASPTLEACTFTGEFQGWCTNSAGMIGYTKVPVTLKNCMFDPQGNLLQNGCATFVRTADGAAATMDGCHCTHYFGTEQGICVFSQISMTDGGTCEILSEPDLQYGGKSYWKSGAKVRLTAPDNAVFDHWTGLGSCFISDPWSKDGVHIIKDVKGDLLIGVRSAMPEALKETVMDGTKYRYLGSHDYQLYLTDEECAAKGYVIDSKGWLTKVIDGSTCYITAVVGWEPGKIPADGLQIHNDLSGYFNDYTLMACIAPHAFDGCEELKTVYFKDTDASAYNAQAPFDFLIGEGAFANCPNLTEVKMMQYTTKGDNHWEMLKPDQVYFIADNALENSPNAKISCHREVYQSFINSPTWANYQTRFIVYDATVEDFTVNGVKYHKYRNKTEDKVLTNADKQEMLENHVRIWNADYQQFNAADLLETENVSVQYTYVVGVDDGAIDSADGTMRIYNDPGSSSNYKNIALGRNAIAGNTHVKAIEFYQTNGNGDNSYSDLKMVIQNGAFKGCTNLRELRMFYYVEDGEDHWESLGPKDVIPGNNIFGSETVEDPIMKDISADELQKAYGVPENFRILVAPSRYQEFLEDVNWAPYLGFIEMDEYDPSFSGKQDFTISGSDGITYGFITNPGGILQTSNTVSQDVSWWTAPRIAVEVALYAATLGSWAAAAPESESVVSETLFQGVVNATNELNSVNATKELTREGITHISQALTTKQTEGFVSWLAKLDWDIAFKNIEVLQGDEIGRILIAGGSIKDSKFILTNVADKNLIIQVAQKIRNVISSASVDMILLSGEKRAALETAKSALRNALTKAAAAAANRKLMHTLAISALPFANAATASGLIASTCWGGSGSYNGDALKKGIRENVLANIHQVGLVGGGYVITTPVKNIVYHTYVKSVGDDVTHAVIAAGTDKGMGHNANTTTTTFARKAFQNKKKLQHVSFYEHNVTTNEAIPMLITIPDSAFAGCDALETFDLRLNTKENGKQALGPENFILGGDSVFAGLDSLKFHIIIPAERKQDFLDSESWAPLKRFFQYEEIVPVGQLDEYGGRYAYAYVNGSVQKVHKEMGHKIEHTVVIGEATNDFLAKHQGALKLCNDIGSYNNYQLDAVRKNAFKGNERLRVVNFTDLFGKGAFGDCYTGLDMTLGDSCFANCPNLKYLEMLYLVTDGTNHIDPIKPSQVKIGKGVLEGTDAKIKMMPQQVAWFEADSAWMPYKDRFLPCIIRPADAYIRKALKDMAYYDTAHEGYDDKYWNDYIDLARIKEAGFGWLKGKITDYKDDVRSFPDFKYFENVGIAYVGAYWFEGCNKLSCIELPSTVKTIETNAFHGCTALTSIELPEAVTLIETGAFDGCYALNTILVRGKTPANLDGEKIFEKNKELKIYVPDGTVDTYKKAWPEYKDYIQTDKNYLISKVVYVPAPGKLAQELGLTLVKENGKIRYIEGNYAMFDSLTVSGPLNGEDLGLIRHLAGADAYDSDPTDGKLRYLNLWNARTVRDDEHSYNGNGFDEYIDADNKIPDYLFENCTAIEEVIFPKSVTYIGENIFEDATSLRRVCVGSATTAYECDILQSLEGIEELVLLTDKAATSDYSDPWEANIQATYTFKSTLGDYLSHPYLTSRTSALMAPFEEDAVMKTLAEHGQFFPSVYHNLESVEGLFSDNTSITRFYEFNGFNSVMELTETFTGSSSLTGIALPESVVRIGADAFAGCTSLDTIYVSADSIAELAPHAFRDLPQSFRIIVPKTLCQRYREAWAEYADHIMVDKNVYDMSEVLVVNTKAPNTLAQELGLEVVYDTHLQNSSFSGKKVTFLCGVRGDFSHIRRLKVVGPISGADLALMRYMAGFCPWANTRNMSAKLEYIDLYDAELKGSEYEAASDMFWSIKSVGKSYIERDNELPSYAFLQCYSLKTLILPKTCTKVHTRALQECENLETLVVGDDMQEFNWSALDDDVSLTRMYLLAKKKPEMTIDCWFVRNLANNYHPTFDAFYVRPSLYQDYLGDAAYAGETWQRTNLISKGVFEDDNSFMAFATHAAVSEDDLATVLNVDGWFKGYEGIRNLTPLSYTAVDTLSVKEMQSLTKLESLALPATLEGFRADAEGSDQRPFVNATGLRYADLLVCDSTMVTGQLRGKVKEQLGICNMALVYVPKQYGETDEHNVVWFDGSSMQNNYFDLCDSVDYMVPYPFKTRHITNTRQLVNKGRKYTLCLPYEMNVPAGVKAYKLTGRNGAQLVFTEQIGKLEAFMPYLVILQDTKAALNTDIAQEMTTTYGALLKVANTQVDVNGYTMRGTMKRIDNKEAYEMEALILQSDNLWHAAPADTPNAYVPAFRTYMLQRNGGAVKPVGMEFEDALADGIESVKTVDADGTERYYDLNGRLLNGKPEKGIYIHNGKKIINR